MSEEFHSLTKRILVYTHSPRAFRTTLVGYVYEMSQKYPIVLLSEKLDKETEKSLNNKKLFPNLEKIIPVNQLTGKRTGLLKKNRYLCRLAKEVVDNNKPDIVILASDMHSLFDMYLSRFAKSNNALVIAIQPTNDADSQTVRRWVDVINAYHLFPNFFPFKFNLFLTIIRKYIGHIFYHWILPLTVGERPFLGKSSFILRKGNSGMRDADYQIVFSQRDYQIYLKEGVPAEKLYIMNHPLTREARYFFDHAYFSKTKKSINENKIILLLAPSIDVGFAKKDYSLIPKEKRRDNWLSIINLINKTFPNDWKILVKPHPDFHDIDVFKRELEKISNEIEIIDALESVDTYVEMADAIICLPLASSTVLFVASLQCPTKPIIALDFLNEIFGDYYKDVNGVEYIDSWEKLTNILELIRNNGYKRTTVATQEGEANKTFSNGCEMLEYLYLLRSNKNESTTGLRP